MEQSVPQGRPSQLKPTNCSTLHYVLTPVVPLTIAHSLPLHFRVLQLTMAECISKQEVSIFDNQGAARRLMLGEYRRSLSLVGTR